jgi:hypothetical protein
VTVANDDPLPEDLLVPHPRRLSPDHPLYDEIMAAQAEAIRQGKNLYRDPDTDLYVMTAVHLWERGYCCYSGCRHCPWVER